MSSSGSSKKKKSNSDKPKSNSDKQKTEDKPKTPEIKLLKSLNDKLHYKYICLNNGLKAFVVSDPSYVCLKDSSNSSGSDGSASDGSDSESGSTTSSRSSGSRHKLPQICKRLPSDEKLSAVAICVRTGSFCDPKNVQGLAHLVEHCITMGSEKFPQENALDNYLTSRGGYQNAHTEYEYTLFEVEVQRRHFYGALQRLAHCFIKPLLKADSIQRETKPVDTEFNEAMNDDEVRIEQLLHNLANEGHPFSAFSWGNAKSLKTIPEKNGTDTQKCVKDFVDKYYYSDNIHIVLQSQESIETLEKWVTELFEQIPKSKNKSKPKEENFGKPYDKNPDFNKLYLVDPIRETDQLNILWSLPPVDKHYNTCPLDYLGHIVGHEGKGSLISFLRKEHLALELAGGQEESGFANNKYSSFFVIQIKLTDLGKEKIDSVVDYVFEYLKLMQTVGPQEWFFNEFKNIEKNRFDWREEQSAIKYVKTLALNMNVLPIEYILRGNKLYSKYDKELIQSYLNVLTPNNACFIRLSTNLLKKDDKDIKTEKWFGTKYKVSDVPSKWMSSQSKQSGKSTRFQFPEPNPFIAIEFTIKEVKDMKSDDKKAINPTKILNNRIKLWHKFDNKFKLPKAIIKLHLISPHIYESVENNVITDLFNEILVQILSEEVYSATLAGLYWGVSQTNSGLVISVGGFDNKLNVLLEAVINRMINCEVGDNKFADVKKNLAKSYHNSFVEPASLNKSLRLALITNRHFTSIEKRAALKSVDQKKFKTFVKKLFSNFYIEALIQGNLTKEESIDLMNKIGAKLKLSEVSGSLDEPKLMATEMPIGDNCCRVKSLSSTNKNSSICNYYQLKPADIRLHTWVSVMTSFMEEPCFNILRTKEGLGYHVSTSDYDTYGVSAYGVSVSSSGNEFECTFVDQRIENFLKLMVDFFKDMKEESFKTHIKSIIVAKKVPDIQLGDEFSRNWNEITSFNYCFDRLAKEIKCLEKIKFEEFKEWSSNQILKEPKKRKLSLQIVGNGTKSLSECLTFDGKELVCDKKSDDEKSDNESSEQSFKKFKLTHLKSKSKDSKTNKFIEDITKFKKSLNVFPVHKVIE